MDRPEAGVDIIKATAQILAEFADDIDQGRAGCEHEGIVERLDALLKVYKVMRDGGFSDLREASNWLRNVSEILPRLWD